jgi:hypothetical protein
MCKRMILDYKHKPVMFRHNLALITTSIFKSWQDLSNAVGPFSSTPDSNRWDHL